MIFYTSNEKKKKKKKKKIGFFPSDATFRIFFNDWTAFF